MTQLAGSIILHLSIALRDGICLSKIFILHYSNEGFANKLMRDLQYLYSMVCKIKVNPTENVMDYWVTENVIDYWVSHVCQR